MNGASSDWFLGMYAPLIISGAFVSISFWRWAFMMRRMPHDSVMRDLIVGIAIGFTALVIENLFYAYARFTTTIPVIPVWEFLLTKGMYVIAAVMHLHAMYRQMTGSNRPTYRVVTICVCSWVVATLFFAFT